MLTRSLSKSVLENMPVNNNQTGQSAATRLASLPVVRSACAKLSVLYVDTKCSHPSLKSACDLLESSVTALGTAACNRVSPVVVKLEPQISIANDVACKSLDWLETSFPILLSPTEQTFLLWIYLQIVATAKNKMHEIQDVVSIAANGTKEVVQHTVTWVVSRMHQADDGANRSLMKRAIGATSEGLDSALSLSEALMDQLLPPTEYETEAHLVEGFEAATPSGRYSARLVSLAARLCRRSCQVVGSRFQCVQVTETLSRSSALVQDLQASLVTIVWILQGLPQYLQHQAVSVFFFISQMYNVTCPPLQQKQSNKARNGLSAAEASSLQKDVDQVRQQLGPTCRMRPTKRSVFESGCNVKGCVRR
ncbi:perilipin-2-like isoform X2 [Amphiprion ocellaris]|uniref:perilipin-2-like isoform X2 n=1 Tax=Amphiprion ocellaris TaxID=80972 RepID=UPI0024110AE2|nr:perilipin-2-like isoform X2 [Amphiprion ocellaris]